MKGMALTFNSGREIPIFGLGTWLSKPGEVARAIKHALKIGYRHIDCAALYGNEPEIGQAIREGLMESGLTRDDVFITSKLWNTKHHSGDVEDACRKSLRDLGLNYLDLYLIHWPTALKRGDNVFPQNEDGSMQFDVERHPTDTWMEMEKLVEKGLVKDIGVCNFNSVQIQDVLDRGKIKPVVNQVECHPYLSQKKLLNYCTERDILLTAYSPLGSPNRPWAKPDEPKLLEDPKLLKIAKRQGKSPAQVVLRWQIQRGVVIIPKSVNYNRLKENFDIFDFELSKVEMAAFDFFECNGRLIVEKIGGKYVVPHCCSTDHPHYPFSVEF